MHFYHVKLIQDTTIEMCVKVKYTEYIIISGFTTCLVTIIDADDFISV